MRTRHIGLKSRISFVVQRYKARLGKALLIGKRRDDPISFDDLLNEEQIQHTSRVKLYDAVSSRIGHRRQELEVQVEKLALEHSIQLQKSSHANKRVGRWDFAPGWLGAIWHGKLPPFWGWFLIWTRNPVPTEAKCHKHPECYPLREAFRNEFLLGRWE